MSNYMAEAFAPVEAIYKEQVCVATWGHLAPRRNAKYSGRIVWAVGIYGSDDLNPTTLFCELKSKTVGYLNDSPWFYNALARWLSDQQGKQKKYGHPKDEQYKSGCVYEFTGYFRNYEFVGQIKEVFSAEHPKNFSNRPPNRHHNSHQQLSK